jgi:hypothetical protein
MLHPDFFTDPDLLSLSPLHRLLFQALWCHADREGRLLDKPKHLKIKIFPADNCDVDAMLDDLAALGLVIGYESGGLRCLSIPGFLDFQHPHKKEVPSVLPPPTVQLRGIKQDPVEPGKDPVLTGPGPGKVVASRAESVTDYGLRITESESNTFAGCDETATPRPVDDGPVESTEERRKTRRALRKERPTNPRHHPLVAALAFVFQSVKGSAYGFDGGRDAKAVSRLLAYGTSDEDICARWARALRFDGYRKPVTSLSQLAQGDNWNFFAQEQAGKVRNGLLLEGDFADTGNSTDNPDAWMGMPEGA